MATQDLQSILAALAASGAASTPQPPQPQQYPPPGQGPPPHGYPGMPPPSATPQMPAPYGLPQPTSGGSFSLPPGPPGGIDLSNLPKPSSVGSLSNFADVMGNVRDRATGLGVPPPHARPDPRMQYGQPRSRSRSPPRGSYNPYRDERRGGAGGYNNGGYRERTRSRSPPRRYNNFSPSMNRGGRERSPVRDSEVIEMDPSVVGLVIGRQGENLKRIEKMTGCKIQFITGPEGAGTRRQCRVDGPLPARKDAISEIFRTISENERGKQGGQSQAPYQQQNQHNRGQGGAYSTQGSEMPELRPGETQQQMMVPDKTVGLIIGRGGETIRDLQERSGCHINIVGENKSVGGLRPVNLIGTPAAAEQAKQLILDIVASDERPENNQNRNQTRNQAPPQQQQPMDQGKINESIHVPSEAVGMIIGKGGETIKNMQNETGCKINVSQPSGPDYEREIGLIGTRGAIEAAKRAIWEKVETVREKSGAPRGGPNNNSNSTRRDDGGGYGNRYSQPQQQQGYGQPPAQQSMPPTGAAPASDPNQPDPYAAWGGYSNYVAWYYSSLMQQGGQAPGGAPPAGGRAPGA